MKKKLLNAVIRFPAGVAAICAGVLCAVSPASCRLTEEGIEILPGDTECPVQESFEVESSGSVLMTFSEKVVLSEVSVAAENEDSGYEAGNVSVSYDESGKSARIEFDSPTSVGQRYALSCVVSDMSGNSVDLTRVFIGYNENPAYLILSEIRTKYDAAKGLSDFVEFYVLKGGNTYGYRLSGAQKGRDFDYDFPLMEVEAGEYITLHSKQYPATSGFVDEVGADLTLSKANDSCDTGRDLWRTGTDNVFTNNDVLVLKNLCSKKVTDGILMYEFKGSGWSKNLQKEYAQELFDSGVWKNGADADFAVNSAALSTINKSLSRINIEELQAAYDRGEIEIVESSADDWCLTVNQTVNKVQQAYVTPGYKNRMNQ